MNKLKTHAINIASLDTLLVQQFPAARWTVQHLIPESGLTILSAAPGSFKTWVMLEIALSVAEGRKLFDKYDVLKTGVLLVDEESGARMLQERFKLLGSTSGLAIYYVSRENTKITQEYITTLIDICNDRSIGLVMFDSLVRLHGADENASKDMAELFNHFKQLADNGIAVLIAHHNRKSIAGSFNPSGDMRGSSDILAAVDCHIALSRPSGSDFVTVQQTKNRYMNELRPFKLRFVGENDKRKFVFSSEIQSHSDQRSSLKGAIIPILQAGTNVTKKALYEHLLADGYKIGMNRLGDLLDELKTEDVIIDTPGPRNATYYSVNAQNGSALKA